MHSMAILKCVKDVVRMVRGAETGSMGGATPTTVSTYFIPIYVNAEYSRGQLRITMRVTYVPA